MEDMAVSDESGRRLPDLWESGEPPPDAGMAAAEARSAVRQALGKVPKMFRDPSMLCDMFCLSYSEISKLLEVPLGTIRSRIFRGRQVFRGAMRPYVEEGGAP